MSIIPFWKIGKLEAWKMVKSANLPLFQASNYQFVKIHFQVGMHPIFGQLRLIIILTALVLMVSPDPLQAAPPAQAPDTPPSVTGGRILELPDNAFRLQGPLN